VRRLTKPDDIARDVFLLCTATVQSRLERARLVSVAGIVAGAAEEYEAAAASTSLHLLAEQADVGGVVTVREMSDLYDEKMVRKGAVGRHIYDRLMVAPMLGLCPLCAQRIVSTLDHHLPKSKYPALACVASNLVPTCTDCNRLKRDKRPESEGDQTIHPYFDDFEDDRWLEAEVVENVPPAVRFFVQPPVEWPAERSERARYHFALFRLAVLYTAQASQELVSIVYHLERLFEASGEVGVRSHLAEQAASREAAHTNSWQTAAYRALAANDWFCSEGFAHVVG
jgi:hypothetical protein